MADEIHILSPGEESLAATPRRRDSDVDASPNIGLGIASGLSVYGVTQALLPVVSRGHVDELTAVTVGAAASLFPALGGLKRLCQGPSAFMPKVAAGTLGASAGAGAGGLIAGATGVGQTGLVLFSVVDGGILLGLTALVGWLATYSVGQVRSKTCPGLSGGPQHRGDCKNRICDKCHIFYFPDENAHSLSNFPDLFLNLRQVYSYLQYQGLDIFDSACLIKDSYEEFANEGITLINPRNGCLEFERDKFRSWAAKNARRIAGYRGVGMGVVTSYERKKFIDSMNRNTSWY